MRGSHRDIRTAYRTARGFFGKACTASWAQPGSGLVGFVRCHSVIQLGRDGEDYTTPIWWDFQNPYL